MILPLASFSFLSKSNSLSALLSVCYLLSCGLDATHVQCMWYKSCWKSLANSLLTPASSWLGLSKRLWLFPRREKCFRTCEQESNWLVLQSNRWINSKILIQCLCFFCRQMSHWNYWGEEGGGLFVSCKKAQILWGRHAILDRVQNCAESTKISGDLVSGLNP